MKYSELKDNEEIHSLIKKGNDNLGILGYTDHSEEHAKLVAERAAEILKKLGYKKNRAELAKIAGYMHDIGNAINRTHHAEYGSLLANDILKETDLSLEDRLTVVSAIFRQRLSSPTKQMSEEIGCAKSPRPVLMCMTGSIMRSHSPSLMSIRIKRSLRYHWK